MNKKDKLYRIKNNVEAKKIEIANNKKAQTRNMKEEIGKIETGEDVTPYGEFVSSYFAWLTLEKQKENANKMENITNK